MRRLKIEDKISIAHRLDKYKYACKYLHGHNMKVEVFIISLTGTELNEWDGLVDFKDIKAIVKPYLKEFDHNTLLKKTKQNMKLSNLLYSLFDQQTVLLDRNPTCEVLSEIFYDYLAPKIEEKFPGITIEKVRVWESDKCYAEYPR